MLTSIATRVARGVTTRRQYSTAPDKVNVIVLLKRKISAKNINKHMCNLKDPAWPIVYEHRFMIGHGESGFRTISKDGRIVANVDENDIEFKKLGIIRKFTDGNLRHYLNPKLVKDHRYINDLINITVLAAYYKLNYEQYSDIFTEKPLALTRYGQKLLRSCGVRDIYMYNK